MRLLNAEEVKLISVRERVMALAGEHDVSVEATSLDLAGMAITRCSGDNGDMDDVEIALVHLVSAGHLMMFNAQTLLLDYLKEREG
jgi:hypothetical protein